MSSPGIFLLILTVCSVPGLGRRIGRGEKWRVSDGGWDDNSLKKNSYKAWLDKGNDAVVAADKEALLHIETEISKLEEAEAGVEADIVKRLQFKNQVDDEDILREWGVGVEGSGRRGYYAM